ncbi:hypothetical protein PROFUN_14872 [Planoprotostelium fungivorum]|uniref:Uncharacterized protein n=1 Tax=Planoprotostelium fungivorum TaxID=1890364 RepID=A0A2P6MSB3_9EUKA|nr:hypothetical protein PROFUN_14872 [Planoprotostelium fungivorum]
MKSLGSIVNLPSSDHSSSSSSNTCAVTFPCNKPRSSSIDPCGSRMELPSQILDWVTSPSIPFHGSLAWKKPWILQSSRTLERATKLGEKIAASCGQTRKLDIKPLTVEEWNTLRTALVATLSNHSRPTNDTPVNFAEDKITMDDSEYSRLILFEPILEKEA